MEDGERYATRVRPGAAALSGTGCGIAIPGGAVQKRMPNVSDILAGRFRWLLHDPSQIQCRSTRLARTKHAPDTRASQGPRARRSLAEVETHPMGDGMNSWNYFWTCLYARTTASEPGENRLSCDWRADLVHARFRGCPGPFAGEGRNLLRGQRFYEVRCRGENQSRGGDIPCLSLCSSPAASGVGVSAVTDRGIARRLAPLLASVKITARRADILARHPASCGRHQMIS